MTKKIENDKKPADIEDLKARFAWTTRPNDAGTSEEEAAPAEVRRSLVPRYSRGRGARAQRASSPSSSQPPRLGAGQPASPDVAAQTRVGSERARSGVCAGIEAARARTSSAAGCPCHAISPVAFTA